MTRPVTTISLIVLAGAGAVRASATRSRSAPSAGSSRPYCNVVSLAVVQEHGLYRLEGTDDQCGNGRDLASVTGLAFPNPDGTIGFGVTIVTAPGGVPVHVDADITLATLGGSWRDSTGASGAFVFVPNGGNGGNPRPAVRRWSCLPLSFFSRTEPPRAPPGRACSGTPSAGPSAPARRRTAAGAIPTSGISARPSGAALSPSAICRSRPASRHALLGEASVAMGYRTQALAYAATAFGAFDSRLWPAQHGNGWLHVCHGEFFHGDGDWQPGNRRREHSDGPGNGGLRREQPGHGIRIDGLGVELPRRRSERGCRRDARVGLRR